MRAVMVPHAPVLLEDVAGPRRGSLGAALREACAGLNPPGPLVVLSPHGRDTGVYERPSGSLADLGLGRPARAFPADDALIASIALPRLQRDADLGVIVALELLEIDRPTAGVAVAEESAVDEVIEALRSVQATLVVSGHTSAALDARAPLTDRPEGHRLHAEVIHALRHDVADLASIPGDLWAAAGSCGRLPLMVLAALCAGRQAEIVCEDAPFGVGYVVAAVR